MNTQFIADMYKNAEYRQIEVTDAVNNIIHSAITDVIDGLWVNSAYENDEILIEVNDSHSSEVALCGNLRDILVENCTIETKKEKKALIKGLKNIIIELESA